MRSPDMPKVRKPRQPISVRDEAKSILTAIASVLLFVFVLVPIIIGTGTWPH